MIIGVFGGLGLFLYGLRLMGEGLENIAGDRLKAISEKIGTNMFIAVLVGTGVTAVIQSSSAATVMVVGFVNAGLMNLYQASGMIMGANIGTTLTTQLVSFNLEPAAPIAAAIGAAIVLSSKGKKDREIGNIIFGVGILFFGMGLMEDSMSILKASYKFIQALDYIGSSWIIGLAAGIAVTIIVQSSTATTALLIALAGTGVIKLDLAIPFILGSNIGTCVTALLSSIGTSSSGKKAAFIHLIFNLVGTILFLPLKHYFIDVAQWINTGTDPDSIKRQIANVHTILKILNTLVLFPFIKYLVDFINRLIPGDDDREYMTIKYIDDRFLETPVVAVGQMIKETIGMAKKAKENVEIAMQSFWTDDEVSIGQVYENEKTINILEQEITSYLVKLSNTQLSEQQLEIVTSTFHIVNDIERIGDHAENLADLTSEKIVKKVEFTKDALDDLMHMFKCTLSALQTSIESYEKHDIEKAESVAAIEERIDVLEKSLRSAHIKRLNSGICSAYSSAIYLDIISNLERIGDHSTNIAETVLER